MRATISQQCEIQGQKKHSKSLQERVASWHAPPLDAEKGSFFVHTATEGVAAWKNVEGKGKNTARQLLQPGSCLERGSLGRPT